MKLLKEFSDEDIGLKPRSRSKYTLRRATRAVLLDKNNKTALLYVSRYKYYKLPGGGLEGEESVEEALKREILEETGCKIDTGRELGLTIEYKKFQGELQISYCFVARVSGVAGEPSFDRGEKSLGFRLVWVSLAKAIELVKRQKPKNRVGRIVSKRDLVILKEAKTYL